MTTGTVVWITGTKTGDYSGLVVDIIETAKPRIQKGVDHEAFVKLCERLGIVSTIMIKHGHPGLTESFAALRMTDGTYRDLSGQPITVNEVKFG